MNKFLYLKVVQGNFGYGDGWEDLCMSASLKEAYDDLNEYLNSGYTGGFRIVNRRVPNPKYVHRKMSRLPEFITVKDGDKNA